MEETKSLRCTHCGSHHLKHLNNEELICESCNAIVKLNKSIEFEKLYKKLLAENKDIDIKNKRLLVSKSLSPHLDKDSLIKYSQDILEVLPEDVLSTFYIKYANRKTNPKDYECYLTNLPNIATKTELDEIIDIIIDNALFREKEYIENIINKLYKEKKAKLDEALQKRREEAELYSDIKRDIFICHQSNDRKVVDEVLKALEDDGYVCWVSYRNLPWDTDNYWLNIEKAIKSCDIFLCISSKNASQSKDCIREVEIASEYNKTKRIEYKIDNSKDITLFKNFFTGQWIEDIDTLLDKVYNLKNKEQSLYKDAKNYLSKYEYSKAKEIFKEILFYSNYKDTDKYITICDKLIACVELINNGFLVDARKKLIELNNIELTKYLLEKCEANLEENEPKDKKEDSIDINKELNKLRMLIDFYKKYDEAEEIILNLLNDGNDSYLLWYYYLKTITKGFIDNNNENISLIFENLYRLASKNDKQNLDELYNKLNKIIKNKQNFTTNALDNKTIRCNRCSSQKFKKINEMEYKCEGCGAIVISTNKQNKDNSNPNVFDNKTLRCNNCFSHQLTKINEVEYRCEICGAIIDIYENNIKSIIDATFNSTYKREGDYIYFGSYPQTIKDKSVKILEKINYNNKEYFLGTDDALYLKIIANPSNENYTFSNGEKAVKGNEYYFKVEPVKWKILSYDNKEYLIFSDCILNAHRFDPSSNDYASSEVKSYLNNEMFNEMFSEKQKNIIQNTNYGKLFLLIKKEIKNLSYGFDADENKDDIARRKKVTDYAVANFVGYYIENEYLRNGVYWLRTTKGDNLAYFVIPNGIVWLDLVIGDDVGLAPALKMTLK